MSEPRAVVPSKELLKAKHPVEASPEIAQESPYAFGLGISTLLKKEVKEVDEPVELEHVEEEEEDDDGDPYERRPESLYLVSPFAAKQRPVEVKSGYYLPAAPGPPFEVIITPLKKEKSMAKLSVITPISFWQDFKWTGRKPTTWI